VGEIERQVGIGRGSAQFRDEDPNPSALVVDDDVELA
jgi:hypothetical protein